MSEQGEATPTDNVTFAHNESENYYIIGNIPSQFHSAHLRAYFSQFTEKKGFKCFHYRHRPQVSVVSADKSLDQTNYCCCIVKVEPNMVDEFLHLYNNKTWELADGELVEGSVKIYLAGTDSLKSKSLKTQQSGLFYIRILVNCVL